jgi:hypothetical protein
MMKIKNRLKLNKLYEKEAHRNNYNDKNDQQNSTMMIL